MATDTPTTPTSATPTAPTTPVTPTSTTPAASKIIPAATTLSIVGVVGGVYNLRGKGFGEARVPFSGSLLIGGRNITFTTWRDDVIKGELPIDLKSGEILLTCADGTVQKGRFER